MKICGMQWGNDGGNAFRDGISIVEIAVESSQGAKYYINVTDSEGIEQIDVLTESVFSVWMEQLIVPDVLTRLATQEYIYQLNEDDSQSLFEYSDFKAQITLARTAMAAFLAKSHASADDFIQPYLGKNAKKLNLTQPEYKDASAPENLKINFASLLGKTVSKHELDNDILVYLSMCHGLDDSDKEIMLAGFQSPLTCKWISFSLLDTLPDSTMVYSCWTDFTAMRTFSNNCRYCFYLLKNDSGENYLLKPINPSDFPRCIIW